MIDQAFLTFIAGDTLTLKPSDVTSAGQQRVIGQVAKVPIRAFYQEDLSGVVDLVLHDVLVVDSLAVPLHVSLTGLQRGSDTSGIWELGQPFDYDFDVTLFPKRYHSHPFWNGGD